MANAERLVEVATSIINQAKPGEQIEVAANSNVDTEVRAYEGEIESFVSASSDGVGIRVIADQRQGFACVGSLDPEAIAETLADARDNAKFASVDPHVGLVAPDGVELADLDTWRENLVSATPEEKIELALELERAVTEGHREISGVESIDYGDSHGVSVVISTEGIQTVSRDGACSLAAYAMAQRGSDVTTGFGFSVGRELSELDVSTTADQCIERALRMLGASPTKSERLTVVFDPWVTAQFVGIVSETFSADSIIKGRSFVAGREGETIASSGVSLIDDATDPRWYGASASDGEGLATRPVSLLDDGVVKGCLMDGYTASVLGKTSTGSAIRHGYASTPFPGTQSVFMLPGERNQDQIISSITNGVFVTEVSGLHSGVNPVSGDFSTGIEGVMIRNGELAEPVREVTIASTLQRMLANVVEVGSDLTALPLEAAGQTLAIADVSLSGS